MMAEQTNPAMAELDLELVVRRLHGGDIRIGIQTYDEGLQVWISDRLYRVREDRVFKPFVKSPCGEKTAWRCGCTQRPFGFFPAVLMHATIWSRQACRE
jgi:hypothetical protein